MNNDIITEKFKWLLIRLMISHGKLTAEEYKRNPSYNDSHFAQKAEGEMCSYLFENHPDIMTSVLDDEELKELINNDVQVISIKNNRPAERSE